MKKICLLLVCIFILTLNACTSVDSLKPFDNEEAAKLVQQFYVKKPAQQMISLSLPHKTNWQRITQADGTIMLIPNQATSNHWQESIRTKIHGKPINNSLTLDTFVQNETNIPKGDCSVVDVKVLSKTDDFILYRLLKYDCQNVKNEIQFVKSFNGIDAFYVVYYTARLGKTTPKANQTMYGVIKSSQLIWNHRYH